jgi:GT2 family glycosyltransferase
VTEGVARPISVVIPSFNRRDAVCALVTALFAQHGAEEIIVVLDGSTDGSAEALAELTPPAGLRLEVHPQPNRGAAAARNAGWRRAAGEIVLFLDDDVVPGEGLVAAHRRAHRHADAVLGHLVSHAASWVPAALAEGVSEYYRAQHEVLSLNGVTQALDVFTGNLSVKRRRLLEVDGFDEAFTGYGCEDWDLGQRLLEAGTAFVYARDAVVVHEFALTPAQWRQHMQQMGRAQVRLSDKYPQLREQLTLRELHNPQRGRRLAAQFAIRFPRLGMMASAIALALAPLAQHLAGQRAARLAVGLGWRLAFWSGVRSAFASARSLRTSNHFRSRGR